MTDTCAFGYHNILQTFTVVKKVRFWQTDRKAKNKEYRTQKDTQK